MSTVQVELDDGLLAILRQENESVPRPVLALAVLELDRRGTISSGKASQAVGMPRLEFIRYASSLGIPDFTLDEDDWRKGVAFLDTW